MHDEFTALMSAVLDHEAPPGDVARLNQHLAGCPACQATWAHWRTLDALFASAPMLVPAQGFVLQVAARLEAGQHGTNWRRWMGSGLLLTWGLVILSLWAGVVVAGIWTLTHPSVAGLWLSSVAQLFAGVTAAVRSGQRLLFDLGGLWLSLGAGFYLGLTVLVLLAWLWLVVRKSDWVQPLLAMGEQSE